MNFKPIPRRFEPSDEELIEKYLKGKIMNFADCAGVIPEAIIYGDNLNPWEKFCKGSGYPLHRGVDSMGKDADYDRLFVFTKITNVGKKSGDFQKNRLAGDGKWHGNHKTEVQRPNGNKKETIGYSRLMTFQLSNGKETVGHWTMNEYTIEPKAFPGLPPSDWVVCKIKKHHRKTSVDGKVIRSEESSCKPKAKKRRQITSRRSTAPPSTAAAVNLDDYGIDDHPNPVHQTVESFDDLFVHVPVEWNMNKESSHQAGGPELMQNELAKELSDMDFNLDDELRESSSVFGYLAPDEFPETEDVDSFADELENMLVGPVPDELPPTEDEDNFADELEDMLLGPVPDELPPTEDEDNFADELEDMLLGPVPDELPPTEDEDNFADELENMLLGV